MGVLCFVGTEKGAFVLRSDDERESWSVEGPLFKGWKVSAIARDPHDGSFLVATASTVYGPALHSSSDLAQWRQIEAGPSWPRGGERKLNQIWTIVHAGERVFAGVDEAGLFQSEDRGESWSPVEGLNEHSTRSSWMPGAGGLCCHAILSDPGNPDRLWCGISAVGVFRSDDGALTWHPKNEGVPAVIEDKVHKQTGRCVHALVADPDDPDVIYRREHVGMFRTRDGGENWERVESGLPSWFGFPIAMDRNTKDLFCIPLESDEYRMPTDGKLRVYRSRDGADSWQSLEQGLPGDHSYEGVLRSALDVDHADPCGVYFGTTAGSVYVSADRGDSWKRLPCTLPRVYCVRAFASEPGVENGV